MNVKRIIPMYMKSLYKVKRTKYDLRILMKELSQGSNRMILVGTPIHKNMGDHLIALAEKQFLEKNYSDKQVIEIPQDVYRVYQKQIDKKIYCDDYIFISGGGWLGNVWEVDDQFIRDLICRFSNNYILIFPQTIYFDKKKRNYKKILTEWRNIVEKGCKFKICFREKNSYECATEVLKIAVDRCFLLPDIALLYEKDIVQANKEKIGLIFRDDIESIMSVELRKEVMDYLKRLNLKQDIFSTISDSLVGVNRREEKVLGLFSKFSECRCIVTDRLHAMIFSILTRTPCIVFDNLTHKISGVYETWLNNSNSIFLVKNMQEFKEVFDIAYKCSNVKREDSYLIESYTELISSINTDLRGDKI